jgi:hypothetical protein
MNRTIKEATVKRFRYESHDELRTQLAAFMAAYNLARRLKTLSGLTPHEYIAKVWISEPDRFTVNPIHRMTGLNNQLFRCLSCDGRGLLGVGAPLQIAGLLKVVPSYSPRHRLKSERDQRA